MSLYGALYSGVSGLTAQSSAMGAISDNITNVSTVGYKNTKVNFQTLVTKQTSTTFYSAGGVQSAPRQAVDVQGLLQASTSQTDIAISGGGFFVVNASSQPTLNDPYFYTRAGSFKPDSEGFLVNAAGYYLQAWPTDAAGNVIPSNDSLTQTNLNVISSDYLETVNLSRVAGSAAATTQISIGANLPANAAVDDAHKTDVQFFDSLGESRSMSFTYTKTADNTWDVSVTPPPGVSTISLLDSDGEVYESRGQLEFTGRPADGSTVQINGTTYEFDTDGFYGGAVQQVEEFDFTGGTANSWTPGDVIDFDITVGGVAQATLSVSQSGAGTTLADMASDIANAINNDPTLSSLITASANAGVLTLTSNTPDQEMTGVTFTSNTDVGTTGFLSGGQPTNTTQTAFVSPTTVQVDISNSTSISGDVAALVNAVIAADNSFDTTNNRIAVNSDYSYIIDFTDDGSGSYSVDPSALLDVNGNAITTQTSSFTIEQVAQAYAEKTQLTFASNPVDGETLVINGITYEFDTDGTVTGTNVLVDANTDLATTLSALDTAIETNDPYYATGTAVRPITTSGTTNNALELSAVNALTYTIDATGMTTTGITDNYGTTIDGDTLTVSQARALNFDSQGNPATINVTSVQITGFDNGAADMDGTSSDRITMDFGTIGGDDGMSQNGTEFTPVFIQQNGSRFGTFAGVSISPDGLVTALFDNGDTRPIYQIPVATFTNPNGLEGRTGNIWNASEASGDYTLRTAGNGPAGVVTQASLEASTVDIGEEFTNMIVVQRAYSASTKIISTADAMLEELMRTKR